MGGGSGEIHFDENFIRAIDLIDELEIGGVITGLVGFPDFGPCQAIVDGDQNDGGGGDGVDFEAGDDVGAFDLEDCLRRLIRRRRLQAADPPWMLTSDWIDFAEQMGVVEQRRPGAHAVAADVVARIGGFGVFGFAVLGLPVGNVIGGVGLVDLRRR